MMSALEEKEKELNKLKTKVDGLLNKNHPASDKIEVSARSGRGGRVAAVCVVWEQRVSNAGDVNLKYMHLDMQLCASIHPKKYITRMYYYSCSNETIACVIIDPFLQMM